MGRANSSGCFRLTNEHVVHLASIARVGTKVKVLQTYAGGVSETVPLSSLFSFWGSEPAKPVARPEGSEAGSEEGDTSGCEDGAAAGEGVTIATDGG